MNGILRPQNPKTPKPREANCFTKVLVVLDENYRRSLPKLSIAMSSHLSYAVVFVHFPLIDMNGYESSKR